MLVEEVGEATKEGHQRAAGGREVQAEGPPRRLGVQRLFPLGPQSCLELSLERLLGEPGVGWAGRCGIQV